MTENNRRVVAQSFAEAINKTTRLVNSEGKNFIGSFWQGTKTLWSGKLINLSQHKTAIVNSTTNVGMINDGDHALRKLLIVKSVSELVYPSGNQSVAIILLETLLYNGVDVSSMVNGQKIVVGNSERVIDSVNNDSLYAFVKAYKSLLESATGLTEDTNVSASKVSTFDTSIFG